MDENGKSRKGRLLGTCATFRACDAADLVDHDGLTIRQAMRRTGASFGYTITALKLSPEQRASVRRGERTLASFHLDPPVPDKVIDRFITKVGFERVAASRFPHGADSDGG